MSIHAITCYTASCNNCGDSYVYNDAEEDHFASIIELENEVVKHDWERNPANGALYCFDCAQSMIFSGRIYEDENGRRTFYG